MMAQLEWDDFTEWLTMTECKTEYITKEQAIKAMEQVTQPECFIENTRKDFAKIIEELPTADVAPVVHGEWVGTWGDGYANGFIVYEEFECSRCGCVHHADGEPTWDYCPNCGARMGGGESDD